MVEMRTKPMDTNVTIFVESLENKQQRDDCSILIQIYRNITHEEPVMWGSSIIGFGKYHYRYESGHEGDMCLAGFSPRKGYISVYIYPLIENYEELFSKLGKYKLGKGCIKIKKLDDINMTVLKEISIISIDNLLKKYPTLL
ncbi:MAG: DUF1801 domain-containing protein [Candidatus Delongbacteria bacterium]|nr:DUF1801 domain-containing protein [Candidatus Delongbacteria bacterium]MBN2834260.1 DUF1801 domain-containing protein [Candidatus Delongbacteria bacterium]